MWNGEAITISVLVGVVGLLVSIVSKLILTRMDLQRRELNEHLVMLKEAILSMAERLDRHLEDHARGILR